jgi:hypothetical protein
MEKLPDLRRKGFDVTTLAADERALVSTPEVKGVVLTRSALLPRRRAIPRTMPIRGTHPEARPGERRPAEALKEAAQSHPNGKSR